MKIVSYVFMIFAVTLILVSFGCSPMRSSSKNQLANEKILVNEKGNGTSLELVLTPGKAHNHPSFAIWAETLQGQFIQTLFVTQSVGTGFYGHGKIGTEQWSEGAGPQSRPASLPYWLHKRVADNEEFQLPSPDHPVPDAYTGATPLNGANVFLKSDQELPEQFKLMMEVNQPWDWNDYWYNTRYDDPDYRTSCQPSLIYFVTIDQKKEEKSFWLNPIGHGHYAGKTGELFTDLSTITTAKEIFSSIQINLIQK